jgi:predicted MFS family arabinose efflux permease
MPPMTTRSVSLAAFRARSFRFQWPADLLTSWAFEMETLILGWYLMVQTGSVLLLTAFGALQFLGTLAAPLFGVLGDRLGSRTILCIMRASYVGLAALLAVLALAGQLTPAWVIAIAGLGGLLRPNDQLLRHSLIGETILPDALMGALALSRASMDSARVAGALAGAGLSALLGIGVAYAAVTFVYAAGLALTFGVARARPIPDAGARVTPHGPVAALRPSRYRDLMDGLVHVATTPTLLAVALLAFLINLTAYPVSNGLLPYVAQRIYLVDATGLGWLVASFSIGALAGSIAMTVTGGPRRPARAMLVYTAAWYAVLLGFAHVHRLGAGIVLLSIAGFVQSVAMISLMAALLAAADERFRARVIGVRMLAVYGLPVGLVGSGVLIEYLGFPLTTTLSCALGLGVTIAIGLRWRASMW